MSKQKIHYKTMIAGDIYTDSKAQRYRELDHLRNTMKGNVKKKALDYSPKKKGGKTRRRKQIKRRR